MGTPIDEIQRNFKPDYRLIGPWRAKVLDNRDPQDKQGKITVEISDLLGEGNEIPDVEPKFASGSQAIPEKGQWVWVEFQHLDPNLPMYYGAWWPDDKRPPDIDGNPKKYVHQITDENNAPKWTQLVDREANKVTLRLDDAGCIIEFDGNSKQLNIFSDKGKGDTAPVSINGPSTKPTARKFDKVTVICSLTGVPMDGMIVQGSGRVVISADQSPI